MNEIICIQTFRTRAEAELAKQSLEAAGIRAMVRVDDAGGTEPALLFTTAGAKVFVAQRDAERARGLLVPT